MDSLSDYQNTYIHFMKSSMNGEKIS